MAINNGDSQRIVDLLTQCGEKLDSTQIAKRLGLPLGTQNALLTQLAGSGKISFEWVNKPIGGGRERQRRVFFVSLRHAVNAWDIVNRSRAPEKVMAPAGCTLQSYSADDMGRPGLAIRHVCYPRCGTALEMSL